MRDLQSIINENRIAAMQGNSANDNENVILVHSLDGNTTAHIIPIEDYKAIANMAFCGVIDMMHRYAGALLGIDKHTIKSISIK